MLTRENADTFTAPWPNDANGDGKVGASGDDLQTRIDILNDFHAEVFLEHPRQQPGRVEIGGRLANNLLPIGLPTPTESKRLGELVLDNYNPTGDQRASRSNKGAVLDDLDVDSSNPPLHMFVLGPPNPPRHVRSTIMPGVLGEALYVSQPAERRASAR